MPQNQSRRTPRILGLLGGDQTTSGSLALINREADTKMEDIEGLEHRRDNRLTDHTDPEDNPRLTRTREEATEPCQTTLDPRNAGVRGKWRAVSLKQRGSALAISCSARLRTTQAGLVEHLALKETFYLKGKGVEDQNRGAMLGTSQLLARTIADRKDPVKTGTGNRPHQEFRP